MEKNNEKPELFCGKRVKSCVVLFFGYNLLFVVLHNLFVRLALINADYYQIQEMLTHIAEGVILVSNERLLGAFWFVPVYLVAILMFALVFSFTHKIDGFIQRVLKNKSHTEIYMALLMIACAALGIYFNKKGINLSYHLQTAFLATPFMFCGWVIKKYYSRIEQFLGAISMVASAAILYILIIKCNVHIELSISMISEWYLFYPISLLGVVFCFSLGKVILKVQHFSRIMQFIGKRTFHYMALHFAVFKLVDWVISHFNQDSVDVRMVFPFSYQLGLVYTVISLIGISLLLVAYDILRRKNKL